MSINTVEKIGATLKNCSLLSDVGNWPPTRCSGNSMNGHISIYGTIRLKIPLIFSQSDAVRLMYVLFWLCFLTWNRFLVVRDTA